jgi:hypothetical protein
MVLLLYFKIQPIRCEFDPTPRQIYLNEKIIQCHTLSALKKESSNNRRGNNFINA